MCVIPRIAISKVNLILPMCKLVFPRKCIELPIIAITAAIPIFIVFYLFACTVPANIILFRLFLRINYDLHPAVIQIVMLVQVHDVKLDH